ncbi:MAG TPA: hypothetical protein DET40_07685 [Lentisphaeria bacterium]|nr:MAG: hypothetical protein A2X45_06610 [Lentisphaerae bacterium GWF2_50_93]HCE43414.1 hypothetical protein [Lentisphaeria bacterium]
MKKLYISIVLAMAVCVLAEEPKSEGRFDVDGTKDGITLKADEISEGGWSGGASWMDAEKNKQYVMANFHAGSDWKKGTFTFTPSKDGNVNVVLRSRWVENGGTILWVLIDDIKLEGADIVNGDFEKDSSAWTLNGEGNNKASIVDKGHSGNAVRVAHDSPAMQTIKVKANKPVKVTYWFKATE